MEAVTALDLWQQIREHDRLYAAGTPAIPDRDYDRLVGELAALNVPTRRIGEEPIDGLPAVEHFHPMLSLAKCYDPAELPKLADRCRVMLCNQKARFVVESKVDGLACCLRYEGGRLTMAATRGNGRVGSDVTAYVVATGAAPLTVPHAEPLTIHGELYMTIADFAALNARLDTPIADARSAATSTLRLSEMAEVGRRRLNFIAHGRAGGTFGTYRQWREFVAGLGVDTHADTGAVKIGEAVALAERVIAGRGQLAYPCDGVVLKVDGVGDQLTMGRTQKHPRWAFAYKFTS